MRSNSRLFFITFLGIFGIVGLGVWQELSMPFNDDISYAILIVQELIRGKHYFTDFINTNPPLAFYIYLPVLVIHKLFHFNYFLSHRLYIFAIAFYSLIFSNFLFRKLLGDQNNLLRSVFLLALAFSFILLPHYEFGQRSHIAVMLIFPYLILTMLRLKNISVRPSVKILTGLSAGIGFALNPFDLLLFIFCELALITRRKHFTFCLTPEAGIIMLIQITYFILALSFYSSYFTQIIPLGYNVYLPGYYKTFFSLLKYPYTAFSLITLITSIFLYRLCRIKEISLILMISNFSFLLSYFLQRKIFYYHILPAMTISTMLCCYLIFELIAQFKTQTQGFTKNNKMIALIFVVMFLLYIPIFFTFYMSLWLNKNKEITYIPFVNTIVSLPKPNQRIQFITFYPSLLYTASLETKIQVASRFDGLWFLPALISLPHENSVQQYKQELIDIVIADMKHYQPNYIFVDQGKVINYFGYITFDYLKFFNQYKSFRVEFSHYTYFKTFQGFAIYKRTVNK